MSKYQLHSVQEITPRASSNEFHASKIFVHTENYYAHRKFRVLNLRGPTPTSKLSENKTHAKISGSTVIVNMYMYVQTFSLDNNTFKNKHLHVSMYGTCMFIFHL